MACRMYEYLENMKQRPQRQDATADQLMDLVAVANRLGCYDAADVIRKLANPRPVCKNRMG